MATLLKCIECDGLVSSQASQCQRCTSRYPFGVKCIVCCETLKRSAAIKILKEYGGAENRVSTKFFHRYCYEQVNQIKLARAKISCPVCRLPIEFDTSSSILCSNCGHKIQTRLADPTFASCCYCGFSLNKSLEVTVKDVQRQFLDGWVTETLYAHRICYTNERKEQQQNSQARERIEKKYIERKKVETKRKKQSEKSMETMLVSMFSGLVAGLIVGGGGGAVAHFVLGFGSSWQSSALFGFCTIFVLTVVAIWISSLFD